MPDIRTLAADAGLSLRALSQRYGIPYRTIQDWALGRRTPPPYVLRLLEEAIKSTDRETPEERSPK